MVNTNLQDGIKNDARRRLLKRFKETKPQKPINQDFRIETFNDVFGIFGHPSGPHRIQEGRYKDKYKHIKTETITLIKTLILNARYFRKSEEEKFSLLKELCEKLNRIYSVETALSKTEEETKGHYSLLDKTIYLKKISLITFLHEFKHSIQHQKGLINSENIARGWSISLFYKASQRHYNRAVEKKLLFYS